VAVFDADFVPAPDFTALVHYFTDPKVGMAQARWGHLNRDHSPLTRVQSILLDGHFVVEHTARNRSGRYFNFNGTAGIWRRSCIDDAGGWQHDTLTEDMDLSYRAQLRGWRFVYAPESVAPAELPVEMASFKAQQHRWAKGSIQSAIKLLPTVLRAPVPWWVKTEAVFHLTANIGYLMMLVLAIMVVPAVYVRADAEPWLIAALDLPLFLLTTVSVITFYVVATRVTTGSIRGMVRYLPFLMAVGIGLCINNARAVLEALAGRASEFARTPKYNLGPGDGIRRRRYRGRLNADTAVEAALAVYFAGAIVAVAAAGIWGAIPFLLLFELGFAYSAYSTIRQTAAR
jgi:cellulose synthase/poly-beta-1,6-N-acetylglucosamine synthase-like glycosyltransferase